MINRLRRSERGSGFFGSIASVEKDFDRQTNRQTLENLYHRAFLTSVLVLSVCLAMASCSSNATKADTSVSTPLISLLINQPPPASLTVGGTATVSATVNNDLANAGVDWVAMCGSAPNCGSFSPAHTASGGNTTFTAPLAVPKGTTVTVTALSATDHSKAFTASVTIISTVAGVTITQPPPASVPTGAGIVLAATVAGDPSNSGVDWKATCGVIDCTPPGFHSAVGGTVTFIVPGPLQIPTIVGSTVTITAFATADHGFNASASFTVTDAITVSLTQAPPATLLTNATATVIAVASNDTTNSGVTWSVSCSASPCGSVSPAQTASGAPAVFTAPPTVPAPNPNPNPVVTITAFSTAAGPGVRAIANVTIVAPISIKITQGIPTGSIVQNSSAPLVATLTNDQSNAGIDWTVSCGTPGLCGTFSPTHTESAATTTYTAPAAVPVGGTIKITATATADPNQTATETDTVTAGVPPNTLLLGQFVMLLSGKNSKNGPFMLGGVVSGDGTGNITGGALDIADATGNASASNPLVTPSTYTLGSDGRGQIRLLINTGGLNGGFGVNGTGALTLSVVFVTPQHALITETDTFGNGTGTLDLQNTTDLASFREGGWTNGIYSLKLSGAEVSSPHPDYFVAGALTIDFSAAGYSYVLDQSDNGVITSVPFTTATGNLGGLRDPNGKLTFNPANLGLPTRFNLDAWLIDATHFVITDWRDSAFGMPPVIASGYLTLQPSSPSVSGIYAFTASGATTGAVPQVAGGILTCGSTGKLDVVPSGGTQLSNQPISATCTAPVHGRSAITVSGAATGGISQFAAYPTSDRGLYLIELDGGSTGTSGPSGAGVALQQTLPVPLSNSNFKGKYAWNFLSSTAHGSQNNAGAILSDGTANLTGATDVNSFDATAAPPTGTPSFNGALTGSFTASPDGRFPLMLTIAPANGQPTPEITNFHSLCYIVDANTCLFLGSDTTAPGTGILRLQNTGL